MRTEVWLPVLFGLSIVLMALPSIVLIIVIEATRTRTGPGKELKAGDEFEYCNVSETGHDFQVIFMENDNSSPTHILDVYPIPRQSEEISVSVNWSSTLTPNNTSYMDIRLSPSGHTAVRIPNSVQLAGVEQAMKGVAIRASDRIGVYAMNRHEATCDGFLVLPNHLLGTTHYAVCFFPEDKQNQLAFVATADGTTVKLSVRNDTRPGLAIVWNGTVSKNGANVTFSLNKGEAVQVKADSDLTGCGVHSDKPIAVFAGNDLTRVAEDLTAKVDRNFTWSQNYLVEQMPDVSHWGTAFYLVPFVFRFKTSPASPGYLVKFVCSVGNTRVHFYPDGANATSFYCAKPGDFDKTFVGDYDGMAVRATHPILVAQMFASSIDLSPSMLLVTPEEKFNSRYVFPTPKEDPFGSFASYVQLAVGRNETDGLLLDGRPLSNATEWTRYSDGSDVVWTSFEIDEGVHTLRHSGNIPFGASVVGHSKTPRFCSYAYQAGLCS